MIYLIGFSLVLVGFFLGVLIAVLCCASGRRRRKEEEIFNPELQKITAPGLWPGPLDPDEQWHARDGNLGKAEREI